MIISVPHCGSIQYMAREACSRLGIGYIETPEYSERTVETGVRISPEHFCFPCKMLIGSAVEALEMGADTLITVAGFGPCRFNYFAELQRRILEREGYRFRIITFDGPMDAPLEFYRNLRHVLPATRKGMAGTLREMALTLRKGWAYDEIEKSAMALRALESERGSIDRAVDECRAILEPARTRKEIEEARSDIDDHFARVPIERGRPHLKVGLVGELLISQEPYFNFDAVQWLAARGAVVERSVHMSDVFTPRGRHPVLGWNAREIEQAALPFLCHEVGGHGQLSVGVTVLLAKRGFDAIVHFFPFTCMPEVIARTIFVRISNELDIPILSISVDEQTGRAGMQTRLEALIDLAWSRKSKRERTALFAGAGAQGGSSP